MPKGFDPGPAPTFEMIARGIERPARDVWDDLTAHIEQTYRCSPRIEYSTCSGKPGWNVKYQVSGKSLCTLYPEPKSFTVLVVINTDLIERVGAMLHEFSEPVAAVYRRCKLFNGTHWLMLPVAGQAAAEDVKRLLHLKVTPKTKQLTRT